MPGPGVPLHPVGREPDPVDDGKELGEHGLEFLPDQHRSHARVPTSAERDVGVRVAGDVEGVGILEDRLVPVRRGQHEQDGVVAADRPAVPRDVLQRDPADVLRGRLPSQALVHRAGDQVGASPDAVELIRVTLETEQQAREAAVGVSESVREEEHEVVHDLLRARHRPVVAGCGKACVQGSGRVRPSIREVAPEFGERPIDGRTAFLGRDRGEEVEHRLGPPHEPVTVLLGKLEHMHEDPGRHRRGEVPEPVDVPPVQHAGELVPGDLGEGDGVIAQVSVEAAGDARAGVRVRGRVQKGQDVRRDVRTHEAIPIARMDGGVLRRCVPEPRVRQGREHVRVPGQHPGAGRAAMQGFEAAQVREDGVGILHERGVVGRERARLDARTVARPVPPDHLGRDAVQQPRREVIRQPDPPGPAIHPLRSARVPRRSPTGCPRGAPRSSAGRPRRAGVRPRAGPGCPGGRSGSRPRARGPRR